MMGNFSYFLLSVEFFKKNNLFKKYFRNTTRVSKGLDPGQDRGSVSPDLGPNSLKRFSQIKKVAASKRE